MSESRSLFKKIGPPTYKRLLQVPFNGIDAALRTVCDGEGDETPLRLSTDAVEVTSTPATANAVVPRHYVDAVRAGIPLDLENDFGVVGDGVADDSDAFEIALNCGQAVAFPHRLFQVKLSRTVYCTTNNLTLIAHGRLSVVLQDNYPQAAIRFVNADFVRIVGRPYILNPRPQVLIASGSIAGYLGDGGVTSSHAVGFFGCNDADVEIEVDNFVTACRVRAYVRATEHVYRNHITLHCRNVHFGLMPANQIDGTFNIYATNTTCSQVRSNGAYPPPHALYCAGGFILDEIPIDPEADDDDDIDFGEGADTPNVNCVFSGVDTYNPWSSSMKLRGCRNCVVTSWQATGVRRGTDTSYCVDTTINNLNVQLIQGLKAIFNGDPEPIVGDSNAGGILLQVSRRTQFVAPSITFPVGLNNVYGITVRTSSDMCAILGGQINNFLSTANTQALLRPIDCTNITFDGITVNNYGAPTLIAEVINSDRARIVDTIVNQPTTTNVSFTVDEDSTEAVITQPAARWSDTVLPVISDLGPSTRFYLPGFSAEYTGATLPAARTRPGSMARLTNGSTPGLIYSDGVVWRFITTGTAVQTVAYAAQPVAVFVGQAIALSVNTTNIASVTFQVEDSIGAVLFGPQTATVVSNVAAIIGYVDSVLTNCRVRAWSTLDASVSVLSDPFNVTAAPSFTWTPSDLGGQYVAAFSAHDGATVVQSGGFVTELRSLYDSAKKLVTFGTTLPTLLTSSGATGDRGVLLCQGGALWTNGNFAAFRDLWAGDITTTNVTLAFAYKNGTNNRDTFNWRDSGTSNVTFSQATTPYRTLLRGPTGTAFAIDPAGAPDGNWHVAVIRKRGTSVQLFVDTYTAGSPLASGTISSTTGTASFSEFSFNARYDSPGAYTPYSTQPAYFCAMVAATGTTSDAEILNMMKWAGFQAGITVI